MRKFRRVMTWALASGLAAFLIVPLAVPFESSGTLTNAQAAGANAEFAQAGEQKIHLVREPFSGQSAANDQAPVIILMHGFGASTFSWRDVMKPLAVAGYVIAYDRPAFGFSDRPVTWTGENPYGFAGNMEILKSLINQYAKDREVILVGHSAGGLLAGEFARTNPQLVQKLVLVAPAVLSTGGASWLSYLKVIPQIDALGPVLVQEIASSGNALLEESYYDKAQLTAAVSEGYRAPLKIIGWEKAFWEFTNASRENKFLENISSLSQPTLLITGEFDTVVATADTKKLSGLIPNNKLVIIPNTAHLPQEENSKLFIQEVLSWLNN
jgi:pimeloyl-ACP methyl ester carboxylesterase